MFSWWNSTLAQRELLLLLLFITSGLSPYFSHSLPRHLLGTYHVPGPMLVITYTDLEKIRSLLTKISVRGEKR